MPNQLSKLLMDDSFVRFLKGKASKEEVAYWTDWMQASKENALLAAKGQRLLKKGTLNVPKPNSKEEFKRLLERIDAHDKIKPTTRSRNRSRNLVWGMMAAAMSLLIVTGYLVRDSFEEKSASSLADVPAVEYRVLGTESGQKTTVQYSDGSRIVLNANSQMRLPNKIIGADTLQVWLEGEALFNITNKEDSNQRTFIVHTPDGEVSVLGTNFSVNTTNNQSQVVLAEGSVKINVLNELDDYNLEYIMTPGEKALFSTTLDNIQIEQVNTDVYTSWAGNRMILDNTPLSEVIKRIEFTYDVKIKVQEEALLSKKLTGRFNNSDLDFLLKGLSEMLDMDIDKQDQTVYINKKTDSEITEL